MRVLVLYESRRGFTLTVARALRDAMRARGSRGDRRAGCGRVDAGTLAAADALVVGTWVSGLIVVRVGPAPGTRQGVDALPDLEGLPTVVFCTCEVSPRATLSTLSDWRRGARRRSARPGSVPTEEEPRDRARRCRAHPGSARAGRLTGRAARARVGG